MPLFQYKARGHRGDSIEGSIEAVSSDAVASQLLESGITPIEIEVAKTGAATEINLGDLFVEKVTDTDIVQFSRQMHSLTKAGVPLLSALHGLSQSTKNKTLAEAIKNITVSLEAGRDLATSFSEQPTIFSLFYVSMIRIGETTGKLDEIFIQLARYLERDRRTRAQIKSALRYPSFVLIAISIAVAIINLFVIEIRVGRHGCSRNAIANGIDHGHIRDRIHLYEAGKIPGFWRQPRRKKPFTVPHLTVTQ